MIDLAPFCVSKSSQPEELRSPFTLGEFTYATNLSTAIRIRSDLAPISASAPPAWRSLANRILTLPWGSPLTSPHPFPNLADKITPCSTCAGAGVLYWCAACDGSGMPPGVPSYEHFPLPLCSSCTGTGVVAESMAATGTAFECDDCRGDGMQRPGSPIPIVGEKFIRHFCAISLFKISKLPGVVLDNKFTRSVSLNANMAFSFSGGQGFLAALALPEDIGD